MNKYIYLTAFFAMMLFRSFGQNVNSEIRNGNKLYQQKIFDQSAAEYKKALAASPDNPIVNYNLGNALFRTNQYDEATNSYESTITTSKEKPVSEKAYYNKGVAFSKQQKLDESIDAWKNALKLDANDVEARENLQKALLEKKKQQQKDDQKKDKNEKKKEDKDKSKQDQKPDEQQSKLNKNKVEQLLKALAQKEKEVQQRMQSKNASPSKQDKDW